MMVPTLDEGKHQSWGSFLDRVKPSTQEETKHPFWNKVGTIALKNKNVTVSACSGAKVGVPGANNLKRPCMDKSQRKERINRHFVVSETENSRNIPEIRCFPLLYQVMIQCTQLVPVQRPLLWAEHPNSPAPPHQSHCFGTGWAKTQQRYQWLLAQQRFHWERTAQIGIFKAMPFQNFNRQIYSEKEHWKLALSSLPDTLLSIFSPAFTGLDNKQTCILLHQETMSQLLSPLSQHKAAQSFLS